MVNMTNKVVLVVGSLVLGAAGAWFMSSFAFRLGLLDLPNERSSHSLPTPRGGGIGILAAFIFSALVLEIPYAFWAPAVFLAAVGFFDDRLGLTPKVRLFFQFLAAVIVLSSLDYNGVGFLAVFLSAIFFALFIVGTTNFYNFMDGINGIAGITGVAAFGLIAIFLMKSGLDFNLRLFAICLTVSILGFLPFNIPKSKLFMGDVGSILLGFVFASMVVHLSTDVSTFICLASFLAPFYADALTTLYVRWRDGEKLFEAHRRHLYQFLANEIGYPHWVVSVAYGIAQMIVGLLMIWAWTIGINIQIALLALVVAVYLFLFVYFKRWHHQKEMASL